MKLFYILLMCHYTWSLYLKVVCFNYISFFPLSSLCWFWTCFVFKYVMLFCVPCLIDTRLCSEDCLLLFHENYNKTASTYLWIMKWCIFEMLKFLVYAKIVCFRLLGTFWKCARIGERKSPYVAISCVIMAFSILFWSWHILLFNKFWLMWTVQFESIKNCLYV